MRGATLRRIAHAALAFVAACAGFAATCAILAVLLPFPAVPVVRTKLEHLARHGEGYDTVFLGSSRIYFQVLPSIFDEVTAAAGRSTRSFNAGVAALAPPEDAFYLEQILARRPRGLRYVFIEAAPLRTHIKNLQSLRAVYWHDWRRLRILWRAALMQLPPRFFARRQWEVMREAFGEFAEHGVLFLRCVTNQGRGSIFTDRFFVAQPAPGPAAELGRRLDGWIPIEPRQTMPAAEAKAYEEKRAANLALPARRTFADRVSQNAIEEMIIRIEHAGATPVLIVPPIVAKKKFYPEPKRMHSAILLDFADLQRFPELFESERRLDVTHLNTVGAQVFTRLLAERFLAELPPR